MYLRQISNGDVVLQNIPESQVFLNPCVGLVIQEIKDSIFNFFEIEDELIFRFLALFQYDIVELKKFCDKDPHMKFFFVSLVYSEHPKIGDVFSLSLEEFKTLVMSVSKMRCLLSFDAVSIFFHLLSKKSAAYVLPNITLESEEELGDCDENELINFDIFTGESHKYIAIEVDGIICGHVKLRGEDTFISYIDAINDRGETVLIKGGIYAIDNWDEITSYRVPETSSEVYVHRSSVLDLNFLRLCTYENVDEVMDGFKGIVDEGKKIYI